MDPWSKGYYSRHIREASMAMEGLPEVVPPSSRVPGQLLLAALILKRRRRRYREEMGKMASILGVFSARAKYRRRGASRGATKDPGGSLARLPPGRATMAPGPLVVALWSHFGFSGSFGSADFLYNFSEFFWHFKYQKNLKYKNSRKH